MLSRYSDKLLTSDLQFGFKAKRSTSMCTMVLKEVISYYVKNGSSVYCTLLDATKAFDRVEYCKLFRVLLYRKLPVACIQLLANMYTRNVTRVSWNGVCSNRFLVKNGVKQGGVSSPILFCLYLDELLAILAESNVVCLSAHGILEHWLMLMTLCYWPLLPGQCALC